MCAKIGSFLDKFGENLKWPHFYWPTRYNARVQTRHEEPILINEQNKQEVTNCFQPVGDLSK